MFLICPLSRKVWRVLPCICAAEVVLLLPSHPEPLSELPLEDFQVSHSLAELAG